MICRNPYNIDGLRQGGCNKCLPCLINARKTWVTRCLLELQHHEESAFVTLTYSNDHYPRHGSLDVSHFTDWLKRLRYYHALDSDRPLRYIGCGEYGEKTNRPHYHAIIFGASWLNTALFEKSWGKGHVYLGDVNKDSIGYTVGYLLKDQTSNFKLAGLQPPFKRQSQGLGKLAIPDLAAAYETEFGCDLLSETGDVSNKIKIGNTSSFIGRYLRDKLRQRLGMEESHVQEIKDRKTKEMLELRQERFETVAKKIGADRTYKYLKEEENQKCTNIETKFLIHQKTKL